MKSTRLSALLLLALTGVAFSQPNDRTGSVQKVEAAGVLPAMPREAIEAGLKSHDRALYIKEGWIRDPYITTASDEARKF